MDRGFELHIVFLHLLQYLKRYGTVVVLQGRDVIVAESQFSPSIYLKRPLQPVSNFLSFLTIQFQTVDGAQRGNVFYLVGVVVSCVIEVMAERRGQHDEQVDAVHLTPQVG